MSKTIIGFRELVTVIGKNSSRDLVARIDTGASKCSIDKNLAKQLGIDHPVVGYTVIKSAHGVSRRPIIKASIRIEGRRLKVRFTLADRKHLKYDMLIGRNVIKKKFIIHPEREIK